MNQPPQGYGPVPGQPQGYGPPPGYGYPPPQPPPKKGMSVLMVVLIILGGMFVLGVGSCLVCVGLVGKAASDADKERNTRVTNLIASADTAIAQSQAARAALTPKAAPRPPPITVSAKQLYDDYHANEVAADEKYKGQNLLVSGTITSIDKDAFGNIVLRLGVGDQFGFKTVHATLDDSQKAKAMQLSKGASQSVLCEGGSMIIGSPTLKDCMLE